MVKREEAMRALESRDWTGAEIDEGKKVSIVYSVRVDSELAEWIADRATAGRTVPKGFPRSGKFSG